MDQHIREISDGKLYTANDMVKIGCRDCEGCSACCRDMGDSIKLDPMDVFRMCHGLGTTFEALLSGPVELHVEDGLILPNLKMQENSTACHFLNESGRCSIHGFRPGICRLFPLGRNYEGDKLNYFVLSDACKAAQKTKLKIVKWLDTPNLKEYEGFLVAWHSFTKEMRIRMQELTEDEDTVKQMNLLILQLFFMKAYDSDTFYPEFYERLERAWQIFGA